ncbi:MAG: lamin tail domain-containing protein [Patescibacteria group bacterium]|nr:lamin tail domain-containing protein [Patescibacteria group bacterium]
MIDRTRIIIACVAVVVISAISIAAQRSESAAHLFGYLPVDASPQGAIATPVPARSSSPSGTVVAPKVNPLKCSLLNLSAPTHAVLLNEIAWAGIAGDQSSREWVELKNPGAADIPLAGWQMLNAAESVTVFFGDGDHIAPAGFYLLERGGTDPIAGMPVRKSFSGVIKNSDESLMLFDRDCNLVDEILPENGKWPAGTAAPDYRTAERSADLSWHTYSGNGLNGVFGTPGAENSPTPAPQPIVPAVATTSSPVAATAPVSGTSRILISEVMAGMSTNKGYQFVELYNPGTAAVDLTGWSMKKKSSTGTESSLVSATRLQDKKIPPGGYFLIAKDGGYTSAVAPDVVWPASYSLAYTNNAVTIYDPNGTAIDAVSWTEIPADQSYSRVSWSGSAFTLSAPTPQNSK